MFRSRRRPVSKASTPLSSQELPSPASIGPTAIANHPQSSMNVALNDPTERDTPQTVVVSPIPTPIQPVLPSKPLTPEQEEEVKRIKEIISTHRRRLRALREQEAIKGLPTLV